MCGGVQAYHVCDVRWCNAVGTGNIVQMYFKCDVPQHSRCVLIVEDNTESHCAVSHVRTYAHWQGHCHCVPFTAVLSLLRWWDDGCGRDQGTQVGTIGDR